MFRLTWNEVKDLRSQIATLQGKGKHIRHLPLVFTEHGTLMLANVLKSQTAVQASIQVVRAFIKLRELAASHKDIMRKINALENRYDAQFKIVFDAIKQIMKVPGKPKRKIGY